MASQITTNSDALFVLTTLKISEGPHYGLFVTGIHQWLLYIYAWNMHIVCFLKYLSYPQEPSKHITQPWRRYYVKTASFYVKMTSFWRNDDVFITSCIQGEGTCVKNRLYKHPFILDYPSSLQALCVPQIVWQESVSSLRLKFTSEQIGCVHLAPPIHYLSMST